MKPEEAPSVLWDGGQGQLFQDPEDLWPWGLGLGGWRGGGVRLAQDSS